MIYFNIDNMEEIRSIRPKINTDEKAPRKDSPSNIPTREQVIFTKLARENKTIEDLISSFDLISPRTERPISNIDITYESKLKTFANKVLISGKIYGREDLISQIVQTSQVSDERARKGIYNMKQIGIIKEIRLGQYILNHKNIRKSIF